MNFPKRKQTGQALGEYSLIGGVVILASIGALYLLSNQLNGSWNLLGQSLTRKPTPINAPAIIPQNTTSSITDQNENLPGSPQPQVSGNSITTAKGTVIDLSGYQQDLSKAINTTGANGTTDMLASTLEHTAKQLLESGEINQSQYNSLVALAKQGHKLGAMEKVVEEGIAIAQVTKDFYAEVTYNGKTMTIPDLLWQMGFISSDGSYASSVTDSLHDPRAQGETATFNKLYQQLEKNGTLSDPAIRQVIQTLSSQIASLSHLTLTTASDIKYARNPQTTMQDLLASEVTHINSSGICETGSGTDTGSNCN